IFYAFYLGVRHGPCCTCWAIDHSPSRHTLLKNSYLICHAGSWDGWSGHCDWSRPSFGSHFVIAVSSTFLKYDGDHPAVYSHGTSHILFWSESKTLPRCL